MASIKTFIERNKTLTLVISSIAAAGSIALYIFIKQKKHKITDDSVYVDEKYKKDAIEK